MEASEVPIAKWIESELGSFESEKIKIRDGTVIIPPPIPRRPENIPAKRPIKINEKNSNMIFYFLILCLNQSNIFCFFLKLI